MGPCGADTAPGGDYWAVVGSASYWGNQAGTFTCNGAINAVSLGPVYDSAPGTHVFIHGNHVWHGYGHPGGLCGYDMEGLNLDTLENNSYPVKIVISNNTWVSQANTGMNSTAGGVMSEYWYYNTAFGNNILGWAGVTGGTGGEISTFSNAETFTISIINNIMQSNRATNMSATVYAVHWSPDWTNLTLGATGSENIVFGVSGQHFSGFTSGYNPTTTNFTVDPGFNNTAHLLTTIDGPLTSCSGFANVTACLGWDANTQSLTNPSRIYDLRPNANCGGVTGRCSNKGFQLPSMTCVNSGTLHDDFPAWLKGIVYLHWNGTSVEQRHDLATTPCGL
jgi:hypothetical protein